MKVLREAGIELQGGEMQGNTVPCAMPQSEDELRVVLSAARENAWSLRIGNPATHSTEPALRGFDLAISLEKMPSSLEYDPAEAVLTASAQTGWAELQGKVHAQGQRLAAGAGPKNTGTLGSVLANGLSNLDRAWYGALRHQVLGMRVMLASGEVAQVGGKLVKNVTGFDLPRLFVGSGGQLGVILESSLRVHHMPPKFVGLPLAPVPMQSATSRHARFFAERIPGAFLSAHRKSKRDWDWHVWWQGTQGALNDCLPAILRTVDAQARPDEQGTKDAIRGSQATFQAQTQWEEAQAGWDLHAAPLALQITGLPSQLPDLMEWVESEPLLKNAECTLLPSGLEFRAKWTQTGSEVPSPKADWAPACQTWKAAGLRWRWLGPVADDKSLWPDCPLPKTVDQAHRDLLFQFDPKGTWHPQARGETP